jgi:hypothetical protein
MRCCSTSLVKLEQKQKRKKKSFLFQHLRLDNVLEFETGLNNNVPTPK